MLGGAYEDLAKQELRKRLVEYGCSTAGASKQECSQMAAAAGALTAGEWDTFLRVTAAYGVTQACIATGVLAPVSPLCGAWGALMAEGVISTIRGKAGIITGCFYYVKTRPVKAPSPWMLQPGQAVNRPIPGKDWSLDVITLLLQCGSGEQVQTDLRTDWEVRNLIRRRMPNFWGARDWDGTVVRLDYAGEIIRSKGPVVDYFARLFKSLDELLQKTQSADYYLVDQTDALDWYKVRALMLLGERNKGLELRKLYQLGQSIHPGRVNDVSGPYQSDPDQRKRINYYIEDHLPQITVEVEQVLGKPKIVSLIPGIKPPSPMIPFERLYPPGSFAIYDAQIKQYRILAPT